MTDPKQDQETPSTSLDDAWASALAEQQAASQAASQSAADNAPQAGAEEDTAAADRGQAAADDSSKTSPRQAEPAFAAFPPLNDGSSNKGLTDIQLIMDVPVQLTVELGRTRLTIKNLLQLGQGSVVELDSMAGEPMDIFVNGYLIAQGEVVVVDDKYGIRLTDIITPSERINRLSRG